MHANTIILIAKELRLHASISGYSFPQVQQLRLALTGEQPASLSQQLSCDPQHQCGTQRRSSICALMYLSRAEDGAAIQGNGYSLR